jgi:hypothetical protein
MEVSLSGRAPLRISRPPPLSRADLGIFRRFRRPMAALELHPEAVNALDRAKFNYHGCADRRQ